MCPNFVIRHSLFGVRHSTLSGGEINVISRRPTIQRSNKFLIRRPNSMTPFSKLVERSFLNKGQRIESGRKYGPRSAISYS